MKFINIEQVSNGFILTVSNHPITSLTNEKDRSISAVLDQLMPVFHMLFAPPPPPPGEEWKTNNEDAEKIKNEVEETISRAVNDKPFKMVFKNLPSLQSYLSDMYNNQKNF